jgi:hypothetical protein
MHDPLCSARLAADAIYLGILTARGVKPLSRLEYDAGSDILDCLRTMGLHVTAVTRVARSGAQVRHTIFSRELQLVQCYRTDFDGRLLRGETRAVIRREAHYFGYPACCAEAYSCAPHAPNDLTAEEQSLLFHHACPGCRVTPALIPHYCAALAAVPLFMARADADRLSCAR